MEAHALRLRKTDGWTYLGGRPEAKKPLEVVLKAFEGDALFAVGPTEREPGGEPIRVPRGQGRRLAGLHFFARPADPRRPLLVSHRGLL